MVKKLLVCLLCFLCACSLDTETMNTVQKINAQKAKEIMDSREDFVILDVRTVEEYAQGHIPQAVLLPDTEVAEKAEDILQDYGQLILVYCRSGRRSALAAEQLVQMGYTSVYDFGGIIDWPYEVTEAEDEIIYDGEHAWLPATCMEAEKCIICGELRGEIGEHRWDISSCTTQKCEVCGKEEYVN